MHYNELSIIPQASHHLVLPGKSYGWVTDASLTGLATILEKRRYTFRVAYNRGQLWFDGSKLLKLRLNIPE